MNEEVRKDILNVIEGVIEAYNRYNPEDIMELSNHIIHSASIYQERYTSMVAIIVYSIGKIMAKGKITRYPQEAWNLFDYTVKNGLKCLINALRNKDLKSFDKCIIKLQKAVMTLDESFMNYADYVIDHARLKKGSKVYEHGVSIKRVSELFGISEWELMNYTGKMRILERDEEKSEVPERLRKARRLLE